MRIGILLTCIFLSGFAMADIPKHVSISYEAQERAVVNYSDLASIAKISVIDFLYCSEPPSNDKVNDCTSELPPSPVGVTVDNKFELVGSGLYLVRFYGSQLCLSECKYSFPVWEQFVAVPDAVENSLEQAIRNFSPLYSFHDAEEYFPIAIEDLFSRSVSDLSINRMALVSLFGIFDLRNESDSITSLLANNGHVGNRVRLDKNLAVELNGDKANFPVYWIADEVDQNNYWVTYYTFFAYDVKYPNYVETEIVASWGNHELDREGISVLFSRATNSDGWAPAQVVYAGHLEDQPTTFLGCADASCSDKGSLDLVRWENGRTKLLYPNYANVGGRPIVYVAHGSHAQKPAYGFYNLEVEGFGLFDVSEPAGSFSSAQLSKATSVRKLDLSQQAFAAFTYSGGLIRPVRGAERIKDWGRFPPFIRYPSLDWTSKAGFDFNLCVIDQNQQCAYYLRQEVPSQTPQLERRTNLTDQDAYISEAIQNYAQPYFVSAVTGNDRQVLVPQGENVEPDVFYDSREFGDDIATMLKSFDGGLFWTGLNDLGVRTLYSQFSRFGEPTAYCFDYAGTCDAGVVRTDIVGNNFVVFVNDAPGRVKPHVLSSGATEFVPLLDGSGLAISRKVWNGDVPMVQVGNSIYFAIPEFFQDATVLKYDLNLRNPVLMPVVGAIARASYAVERVTEFKGKLYFVASRQGNSVTYTLWSWDGISTPELIDDVGSISKMVTTTNTLYLLDRNVFLGQSDGSPESVVNLPSKRFKDLIPIGDTLYVAEGLRGVEGWGPMSIHRVVDGATEFELLTTYSGEIETPRAFRGELYFFDDMLRKIDAAGQIESIVIPNFVPVRTRAKLFPGDDDVLLFKAYDSVYGNELWSLQ